MEVWIWPLDENAVIYVEEAYGSGEFYWRAWPAYNPEWEKTGGTKAEAVGKVFLDMANLAEDPGGTSG